MRAIVRYFSLFGIFCWTQTLATIDLEHGTNLYQRTCTACHRIDGTTSSPLFPKLAGQHASYLKKELLDYQQNKRIDPTMHPIAQKLSVEDIQDLLAYMPSFKPNNGRVDPKLRTLGEKLFRAGDLTRGIPACSACHGPDGMGNEEAIYPMLAGQNMAYIIQQLQNFHDQKRTNDPHQMMQIIAAKLSPQDIQALASFINGLRPAQS